MTEPTGGGHRFQFRMLGPVEVSRGGQVVALGGAKPRTLLAALLIDHGQVVPTERLVDVIWGDDPPDTAKGVVQTYVAGLRRRFADRPDLISTRTPGYVLTADPHDIDAIVFERLVASARRAVARADLDDAARDFRAALDLWHGPALGGVSGDRLAGQAARLEELRLSVLEERLAVDLDRARHEELVPELTALVREQPTRDGLRRQLMLALYRCNRDADALTVYRDGRQVLVDELGIEPGPALHAVHEAILRRDESLRDPGHPTTSPDGPVATKPPSAVPAQLPAVPSDFVGRTELIAELGEWLSPHETVTAVRAAVVTGRGGVGKSTLAVRVAHEIAANYPDGQLFVALHGLTPTPAAPETVLARFLSALGDPAEGLPPTVEGRVERYRSLVAGRRILVFLDDAANEQQVRPLLPGSASCAVLITSRSRLPGLEGARRLELDVLPDTDARQLLARIAGAARIDAEPAAATQLAELCGHLPLAVRIVGTRLAIRPHWSVEQLRSRLGDEQRRLDELSVGDHEVRASISLSYATLDAQAQCALRRLGQLGLPDFPAWIVSALLDSTEDAGEEVLERLVDNQFVDYAMADELGQPRYRIHHLLRLYAAERARIDDRAEDLVDAVRRVMRCWLAMVDRIEAAHPSGGIVVRQRQDTTQRTPAVAAEAVARPRAWFTAEQEALIAGVEQAAALDLADEAAALASSLCGSAFATGNLFDAWTRTHVAALASVRRVGNRAAESTLLAEFGQLRYEQDRYAEARTYFVQALTAFRELGDTHGQATTLAAIGTACRDQGYLPEALHFLGEADALLDGTGDPAASATVRRVNGSVHLEQGDWGAAHGDLKAALAQFRAIGGRRGEALTLRSIGLVHRAQGDYAAALDLSRQALAIFTDIGDEHMAAYAARAMAKAQLRLGDPAAARRPLQDGLILCQLQGDRWGEALTLRTIGELCLSVGELEPAREHLHAAIRLWQVLDLPLARARTLRDLARVHRASGEPDAARSLYTEGSEICRLYGAYEYQELLAERDADYTGS